MKNNNKKIINKLTMKSLKSNRNRTIILVIAIALTSVLFTTIATIGVSLLNSFNEMQFREMGYSSHGYFQYLTDEETDKIISSPLIKDYGVSKVLSIVNDGDFLMHGFEIRYCDEQFAKQGYTMPTTGKLPEHENEIAMDAWILDKLGIPHVIGENIHLEYMLEDKKISDDFILSGFWENEKEDTIGVGFVYVSKEYAYKVTEGFDPAITRKTGTLVGINQLYVFFDNASNLDQKGEQVLKAAGLSDNKYVGFNSNYVYNNTYSIIFLIPVFLFALIVMVSGYLLIYNIFYISILRDIRFYGLLKTVGTTPKQLKMIVIKQALILSIVGIPLGIVVGSLVSYFIVPLFISVISIDIVSVTINPLVIVFAIVFSLITILISCLKPAKIASKVSSIEAIRYVNTNNKAKKKKKTTTKGNRIWKMSFDNLFRNKKKLILSITSLTTSFFIFLYVFSHINSYSVDKFLSRRVAGDFTIAHDIYFSITNAYDSNKTTKQLTESLCKEIERIDGVEAVNKVYYDETDYFPVEWEEHDYSLSSHHQLYGLDMGHWNRLEDSICQGEFDYEKFSTGNYIIIYQTTLTRCDVPEVGDIVPFKSRNDWGIDKEYEVMGIIDLSNQYNSLDVLGQSTSFMGGYIAYIPSSEFLEKSIDTPMMMAVVDVDKEKLEKLEDIETHINGIIDNTEGIHMKSKRDMVEEFNDDKKATSFIGYSLCLIIILIGFLNYANTNITNVLSRNHELAILEGIGMTKKQIKKSLQIESIGYALITLALGIIVGIPITYLLLTPVSLNPTSVFVFNFSIVPFLIYFPILVVIGLLISNKLSNILKGKTVVERLREME